MIAVDGGALGVPEVDLTDPAVTTDPVAAYGAAREQGPVARLTAPALELWAVTRHEDARRMLTDRRFRLRTDSYQRPDVPDDCVPYLRTMQEMEGAAHTRLRRLATPAFSPQHTAAFRQRITVIVDGLLDDLTSQADGGVVDLVPHLAQPLPMDVISALVGVPEELRPRWREYGAAVAAGHGRRFAEAIPAIVSDAKAVVEHRRRAPADDLVSALLASQTDDGDRLDEVELVTLVWQLVLNGQTPTNLLANAVVSLFAHPDQLAALRADPSLMPRAVDELHRWCGPQLLTVPRFAEEDVEIDGTVIRRGDRVTVAIPAANRDPRAFTDPERFDITRTIAAPGHLSFGHGPHFCLGATLARAQTEIALTGLLARFPDLAPAVPLADLRHLPDPATLRVAALPVTL